MKRFAVAAGITVGFLALLHGPTGRAAGPPGTPAAEATTFVVGAPLRTLALPAPTEALEAMRTGKWTAASAALRSMPQAGLSPAQRGAWAFLIIWVAVAAGDASSASDVLPLLEANSTLVPEVYVAMAKGELAMVAGHPDQALAWFDAVSAGYRPAVAAAASARAADALIALGRPADARARLQAASAFVDRSEAGARLLLRSAELAGPGSDEAYALLRRVWTEDPGTDSDRLASAALAKYPTPPTWQERALRGERWMDLQDWGAALADTESVAAEAAGTSAGACRLRFVRGRSLYKRNRISEASAALAKIGSDCASTGTDYGPKGLYLLGTAQYRRKQYQLAADAYRDIVKYYPTHSMADDALTRGGIALLEAGQADLARAWWEEALRDYPNGDTVPEALLRLSLHRYLTGDGADAREVATKLGQLPLQSDALSVAGGRYWSARWRLFGDSAAPDTPSAEAAAKADAVGAWRALCEQLPQSFYSILAYSRLAEVAPDVASALTQRPAVAAPSSGWHVRWDVARDPHIRDGVALARIGLINEARAEWGASDIAELRPDERAWLSELRVVAGDWLAAHDELRRWLSSHPLTTLGEREPEVVRLAYPDRYWEEVKTAVKTTYRYEPRLFHSLVREESSFDPGIVSFAGAVGLSQLMPATARQTAGWMNLTVTDRDLVNPSTNLQIGARYLDALVGQLGGSPYLALAAYNGGATNVTKWVAEDENPPTDEYIEQIPFEETRGYVKRVMGTWQTVRYRYDVDRPPFPDLSKFNHRALVVPAAGSPP